MIVAIRAVLSVFWCSHRQARKMILTCPQCATQYRVDAAKFPAGGRSVRCAKCSHRWRQDAPRAEASEPVFAVPAPEPVHAPDPVPEPPRRAAYVAPELAVSAPEPVLAEPRVRATSSWPRRLGLGLGWAALVAVVLVIGVSASVFRQQVAQAWPRSASLYAALGLPVNPVGIEFADVTHRQETEDGQAVLSIAGKLVNASARKVAVPPIEVTLTDGTRHAVLRKSFAAGVAELLPHQTASFLARLSSPPAAARHLELRFARR
jgi:predicted Zn finger-like uncharacterized protein